MARKEERPVGRSYPTLDGVVLLGDADFQRLAASKRREKITFNPVQAPDGLRRGATVYVEGESRKTIESGERKYRLVAHVQDIEVRSETNHDSKIPSVTLEWTISFLTEEDWKSYPRRPFIPNA